MCGIVGGSWLTPPKDVLNKINNAIYHLRKRGPNDQGYERYPLDNNGIVILGHTRLSIIDLSAAGHQPMVSSDGRFSIVFNGEIYNYRELRQELTKLGHIFTSDTDTEVLLAAWQQWHVSCLPKLEGMFAFVIYDKNKKTLTCARDAFGIKPFFYEQNSDKFLFASEQKALLALRDGAPTANWQRCYDYLVRSNYDSQRDTFISDIQHLMPGHWLEIDSLKPGNNDQKNWWKPSTAQTNTLSFKQAAEAVREQFLHNIKIHLRSDVPLGATLSGGIDSSAVVCAMRCIEPELPIHTFSYIAPGFDMSEEKWIDHINHTVGAISHKITATAKDLERDLDVLIETQGEPFGSTSIYAQFRIFQLAREQGITVTLDGQGADELLAGYLGYPGYRILSLFEQRQFLEAHRFASSWGKWPGRSYKLALAYFGNTILPQSLKKIARKISGLSDSYTWLNKGMLKEKGVEFREPFYTKCKSAKGKRVLEHLENSLQYHGLPKLLRHGDRNSMQFSVEGRVPFLTIPLAELLFSLPEEYLISKTGETKHVFRAAMRGIVPDNILDRKDKIGFATPEQLWLTGMEGTVRNWLKDSHDIPLLNYTSLLKQFDEMMAGKTKFGWQAWRWINFVKWSQLVGIKWSQP